MRSLYGKSVNVLLLSIVLLSASASGQDCPAGAVAAAKSSALYIYFPTSSDATFPSYGGVNTSPVAAFDMAQHDGSLSTSAVRQRAFELLQAGYCEFDVNVKLATSTPAPSETRWQIVGVGSDTATSGGLIGKAQAVDTGDNDSQDYARFWVESLESWVGASLSGANSTVERWATAIANLVAHESAHNYGGQHSESAPRPGEDAAPNHFEADPAAGATPATISDRLNHFSDTTYERFGHDIGLNIKTLHNWDFTNPNGSNADSLVIRLLSPAGTLSLGWVYGGSLSPWTSPAVTKQPGTITFRGTAYNVFDLTFSTPDPWDGGAAGIVPPGVKFHVGASFTQPDPVIVYETTLRSGGSDLALKPRMFGYDEGTNFSGFYGISFFNPQPGELILSDLQVLFLPRLVDIEQMVVGGQLRGLNGQPVRPFSRVPGLGDDQEEGADDLPPLPRGPVRIGREPLFIPVARLTDRRHLDVTIDSTGCVEGREGDQGPGFGVPGVRYCPKNGTALSLFPATSTYVIATVTDPNAQFWDPAQNRMVTGPLSTRLFFQAGGTVPDFNDNGTDDLLDIRSGRSSDGNGNGIPDEAERRRPLALIVHAGAAIPHGSAASAFDPGLSLDLDLEYAARPAVSVLAILGFHRLSAANAGPDLEAFQLAVDGRYYFATSALRAFAQGGLGVYALDPGDTEIGANVGAGLQYEVTPRLSLEALYSYHVVDTGGSADLELSVPHIGLRWKL